MYFLEQHLPAPAVDVSVVIPVFNERQNLPELFERVAATLSSRADSYEVIFVDDGSTDGSTDWLRELAERDGTVCLVELQSNSGQHPAVFAGLEAAGGEVIVTLDADLQNPPEEIPKLLDALEAGHDVAAGWRAQREDSLFRRVASRAVNRFISYATGVRLNDYGCMLRAYRREVVDCLCRCPERSSFIPALANVYARSVVEVPVEHAPRTNGDSKYSLLKLLALNFDLVTGFSELPIRWVSGLGLAMSGLGLAFGLFLLIRRFIVGPEAEGVFTLMAILFVFSGIQLFALGLVGEYVARAYAEARGRPRYVVRHVHGRQSPVRANGRPPQAEPADPLPQTLAEGQSGRGCSPW